MPIRVTDYRITRDKCYSETPYEIIDLIEQTTYYEPADRIRIEELIAKLEIIEHQYSRLPNDFHNDDQICFHIFIFLIFIMDIIILFRKIYSQ